MIILIALILIQLVLSTHLHIINPASHISIPKDSPVIIFDLDNTLYSRSLVRTDFHDLTIKYMRSRLKLPHHQAKLDLHRLKEDYDALVVRGLVEQFGIDGRDFERYIDERTRLPETLKPDGELRYLLSSIRAPKYILTNSGLNHALSVLAGLNIQDQFDGIFYVDYALPEFHAKPDPQVYRRVQEALQVQQPQRIFFVDDIRRYVEPARSHGWNAIHLDPRLPYDACLVAGVPTVRTLDAIQVFANDVF